MIRELSNEKVQSVIQKLCCVMGQSMTQELSDEKVQGSGASHDPGDFQ